MRFTANEDFKHDRHHFEAENSYSAERYGLTEGDLKVFWAAGWAEVEGWDKAPDRQPGARTIIPDTVKVQARG